MKNYKVERNETPVINTKQKLNTDKIKTNSTYRQQQTIKMSLPKLDQSHLVLAFEGRVWVLI